MPIEDDGGWSSGDKKEPRPFTYVLFKEMNLFYPGYGSAPSPSNSENDFFDYMDTTDSDSECG